MSVLASTIGLVFVKEATSYESGLPGISLSETAWVPGDAHMDGVASVAAAGGTIFPVAAHMDGLAQMQALSVLTANGAAQMDGQADVLANGVAMAVGAARMDGQAQVLASSVNMAVGYAQMNGRASSVVLQSVPGAGLTEMDGEASMLAVAPNRYNVYLQDGVVGSEATLLNTGHNPSIVDGIVGGDALTPKLRYRYTVRDTVNLTHALNYKMRFVKTLRDVTVTMIPKLEPHLHYHYDFTIPIEVEPELTPEWFAVVSLVQNLLVDQTTSEKLIWGRTLIQALKILAPLNVHGLYPASLTQLFKIIELEGFKLRHPVALNQEIDLSLSLTGGYGLRLLQKLLVATTPSPKFNYHFTLTNRVIAGDALEHLVSGILEELFTVHPVLDRQFVADSSLAQLLTIHPALNTKLVLKIVGNIQLSPEQLVSMIYRGDTLLDGVAITAIYISPSGTTTTWVVNTRTNAVTEYDNYEFRSFASMGNRYIAAGAEGLYELDGDTDDGAAIISRLMSGYLQLNEKKMFGIKGAYVAIRGGGRFYLRLIAGDGREYTYELKAQPNLMTTKVQVGKGIRTTYMAFELVTEGQDFDLDSIEFIPITSGRRV